MRRVRVRRVCASMWALVLWAPVLWAPVALAQMPQDHPETPGMDWQIPAVVMVAGLLVGFLMLNQQTKGDEEIEAESRRIDLRSTRDEVIEALRQLELEQGKMDPALYASEREALLARGARAMAVLDGVTDEALAGGAPAAAGGAGGATASAGGAGGATASAGGAGGATASAGVPAPTRSTAPGLAPEWRGALYATGAILLIGGFVYFAQQGSTERQKDMGMTGGEIVNQDLPSDPTMDPQFLAQKQAYELRLAQDPSDVDALNLLTQLHFSHQKHKEALDYNTRALEIDPTNPDARTYLGVLSFMMSLPDRALEHLDGVLEEDPDHALATTYKGLFLMEMGRFDEAVVLLERSVALQPGNTMLGRALNDARALARGEAPSGPGSLGGSDLFVSGTMDLPADLKAQLKGSEVVFVSLKNPSAAGPPIAAKKLPARFPAPFSLSKADVQAMPGAAATPPPTMTLSVRIDIDGNAMTREAAPAAVIEGVPTGTTGLSVTLSMDGASSAAPRVAPAAPPAAPEVLVSGTARLGAGAEVTGSETVFISVKDPRGGPPLAATRGAPRFPMSFQITSANLLPMAGNRPVPDQLLVSVRLDKDGSASTRDGEPEATLSGVAKGSTGLELTLQ
ncbi:MAG TPA: tetratricopeptide repeat protein [Deltaproteobacteria bacterium]|nr:tetratricopeptide repeat protein [Deltaproteobacteria bacterium]